MSATDPVTDSDVPWIPAAVVGVVAYVVEYVVVYLWQANTVKNQLSGINFVLQLLGGKQIPAWKGVGWLFYNAHFVAFSHPAMGGGRAATNFISSGNAPQLLYVVPPVFLIVGGYLLARHVGLADPTDGALAGTVVSLGYAIPAWFCVFAFRVTANGTWMGPDLVTDIVIAGVVYPVVFGAIGGAIAGATTD